MTYVRIGQAHLGSFKYFESKRLYINLPFTWYKMNEAIAPCNYLSLYPFIKIIKDGLNR